MAQLPTNGFDLAGLTSLLGGVSSIVQPFASSSMVSSAANAQASSIRIGGDISAQGQLLNAAGLRVSAQSVQAATQFNLGVDAINTGRRVKALNDQFRHTVGQQIGATAANNISVGSKSALLLRNEAMTAFHGAILNVKQDAENQRRSTVFQSDVAQINLENQARASEFGAAATRIASSNQAADVAFQGEIAKFGATTKAVSRIPTILGQIFQE